MDAPPARAGQPAARLFLFFILSKTVGIALLPVNLLIELGVIGAVLLATRFATIGRRLMATAVVLLALAGFSPLGSLLAYPLESRFPEWDPSHGAPDGIIVLGGPLDASLSVTHHRPVVRSASDRIIAAAVLAHRYPHARLVYSGGSANLLSEGAKEADFAADLFESLDIAKERIVEERQSRNTYENAVFTKQIVQPKPGERWLLVTSGYHMPRSVGLFRKVGFKVEPYPVDWKTGGDTDLFGFTNMAVEGLTRTDTAVREWIGLVAYRLSGRIDELLPGPAKE